MINKRKQGKMKKWIVMLAMLSLLTACAQKPEPESAELKELSAAILDEDKEKLREILRTATEIKINIEENAN